MTNNAPASEYVAALCFMTDGELVPYDSKRLIVADKAEAIRKAVEWSTAVAGPIEERTWLQVILNGTAVYSQELGVL
jgi:hypothetical protein